MAHAMRYIQRMEGHGCLDGLKCEWRAAGQAAFCGQDASNLPSMHTAMDMRCKLLVCLSLTRPYPNQADLHAKVERTALCRAARRRHAGVPSQPMQPAPALPAAPLACRLPVGH